MSTISDSLSTGTTRAEPSLSSIQTAEMRSTAYSCVVDNTPLLLAQAFLWVNCLKQLRRVPAYNIFVHTIDIDDHEFLAWLVDEGTNVITIPRFHPLSPHCNKIQQLATFHQTHFQKVVLLDCDTAVIGERRLPNPAPISASIVHHGNPPAPILATIFEEAVGAPPDWVPVALEQNGRREQTDRNNCNGGVYVCDRVFLVDLEDAWRSRALWSLEHLALYDEYRFHVDQVSFALAMRDLKTHVQHLDLAWNFPTHAPPAVLPNISPQIIHYHSELTSQMKLKTIGLSRPDAEIDRLNIYIGYSVRRNLLNSVWWNFRYFIDPELGSGMGSRGKTLEYKHMLLLDTLSPFDDPVVVDIGCGDLEVVKSLPIKRYHGFDIAAEAVEIARNKRPDWRFDRIRMGDLIEEGDVVLCIDVLIHQPTREQFLAIITKLSAAARYRLVVSGYDEPPTARSEITRYYLPVSEALRQTGAFSSITVVGRYGASISVVVADKQPATAAALESPYFDYRRIQRAVDDGDQREVVGGPWDEIGDLQYRFLIDHGLKPEHALLDIGCGSLRGGAQFIRYLHARNYVGVDINQSPLDASLAVELGTAEPQDKIPRENSVSLSDFEFDRLGRQFDFALAHSLFSHLTFNCIRRCLERLAPVIKVGGHFFATFFELPRGASSSLPYTQDPGEIVTYDTRDPYHYKLADFFYAASGLPWQVRYIGEWGHPRGERMLEFIRL
jgi:2-polyprenyl-3-methyl-5-hydroxy-6-metoxy-1,4-benzoquinol methylase